jgi:para-nitrobenzyl esterase
MSVPVATSGGRVSGSSKAGVHAFLGVPYAAAPTGALRFRAPKPARWDGVREAARFGATAPQPLTPGFAVAGEVGDDYLHVNVYTPELGGAALPVLVWIHGGAWVTGSNADPWSQGAKLAARGMVVISVNYRLGVDGFLWLDDAGGNRAVLDWLAALHWVQDNAAAFGGDPTNVTIGGQSAGSASCLVLATMPRASGLFRRVFAMSGVPWNVVYEPEARQRGAELVARLDVPATMNALASVPLQRLNQVQHEVAPAAGIGAIDGPVGLFENFASQRTWLGPVVDGDLIPAHPIEAIRDGATAGVELLIGSTAHEVDGLFALLGGSVDADAVERALIDAGLESNDARAWLNGRTPAEALGAALTARCFRAPILEVAETRAGAQSTFVYEVTWRPPTILGAVHAFDIPYAFDNAHEPGVEMLAGGPPPQSLADDFSRAVTHFVCGNGPGWPAYGDDHPVMHFDVPSALHHDAELLSRTMFASTDDRSSDIRTDVT